MPQLLQFWAERAPRERIALAAGVLFLALALLYALAIEPAVSGIGRLQHALPQARKQASQLRRQLDEVKDLRHRPAVARLSAEEARAELQRRLGAAGLKAEKITTTADGALQLVFANVDFATWANWIANTEGELGARTLAVRAHATPAPGHVDVDLTLALGPGQGPH